MSEVIIRNEVEKDYREVEELTREAFWNLHTPECMLVKELSENVFDGRKWVYHESTAFEINEKDADEYDKLFKPKKKEYRTSQEEFFIYSHSSINS